MYAKYQTDVLILGSQPVGEADKVFSLYTRDFGLLHARASGVRREQSRMRYALQNFSRVRAGLVRGTHGWRIAGASLITDVQRNDVHAAATFVRIARLTERLVNGEEKSEYLFSTLADAHTELSRIPCESRATIELVCVARVLYILGYLSVETLGSALFAHTAYSEEHLKEAGVLHERLLSSVNRAIAEAHL